MNQNPLYATYCDPGLNLAKIPGLGPSLGLAWAQLVPRWAHGVMICKSVCLQRICLKDVLEKFRNYIFASKTKIQPETNQKTHSYHPVVGIALALYWFLLASFQQKDFRNPAQMHNAWPLLWPLINVFGELRTPHRGILRERGVQRYAAPSISFAAVYGINSVALVPKTTHI